MFEMVWHFHYGKDRGFPPILYVARLPTLAECFVWVAVLNGGYMFASYKIG